MTVITSLNDLANTIQVYEVPQLHFVSGAFVFGHKFSIKISSK